jgi:hypothetical protein
VLKNVLEEALPEKEKAQAEKPAPKFISIFRITSPEGNYAMFSGFILCVESSTWRELGALGGLTGFWARAVLGNHAAAALGQADRATVKCRRVPAGRQLLTCLDSVFAAGYFRVFRRNSVLGKEEHWRTVLLSL